MIDRKQYPHLWGAMTKLTSQGGGDCFWRAAGFVLDRPGAVLCVGIFRAATLEEQAEIGPDASTVPFFHAWCEFNGGVVAPTTFERAGDQLILMNKDAYYAVNGAQDVRRMTRPELLKLGKEIGLIRMLLGRQLRTSEPLGSKLMDALGFAWRLHESGGMVPAEGEDA